MKHPTHPSGIGGCRSGESHVQVSYKVKYGKVSKRDINGHASVYTAEKE